MTDKEIDRLVHDLIALISELRELYDEQQSDFEKATLIERKLFGVTHGLTYNAIKSKKQQLDALSDFYSNWAQKRKAELREELKEAQDDYKELTI